MTDQITSQALLLPGPPAVDGARRCKQPGCGTELPAATGRGAPRLFCSPACSRKWHNDNRGAAGAAGGQQPPGPPDGGPLAGLHQLLTQAAGLASAAAAQLAAADPARVAATLAAADAARGQAQAETAVALARAAQAAQAAEAATAAAHAARHDTQAALEAADQARADADAADARAQAARDQANDQITEIRRRADAARERDTHTAACTAQLAAIQALADTWRARAEHAEHQLDLERDHQRRLAAQPAGGDPGDGAPPSLAAPAATQPATARATARTGASRP